ncbi:MAG: hypothetical protein ACMUIS_11055 [bacterium]
MGPGNDAKNGCSDSFGAVIIKHKWPIAGILFFLVFSFLIISSDYRHLSADAGIFGRSAKIFYEQGKIDTSGAAPALIGQLLFTYPFFLIPGFNLKMIHFAVYVANFFMLLGMYLLLSESKVNPFLAFFGALTLLISPISLRFIDWYMTEPFFMFYLVFSLLFFMRGLRKEKILSLYIGSLFCILGILTRQYAISVSAALLYVSILYYKKLNKKIALHSIAASLLPFIAIGLFYLVVSFSRKGQPTGSYSYTLARHTLVSIFTSPFNFIKKLYYGILFSLHYIPLYVAPLFFVFYISLVMTPEKIKDLVSRLGILTFSIAYLLLGTVFLYSKKNQLMPYLPSIFSIGALTSIFDASLLSKSLAAILLTFFTGLGGIIILTRVIDFFFPTRSKNTPPTKKERKRNKKQGHREKKAGDEKGNGRIDFGEKFLYLWGIIYVVLTILLYLRYDRYIYPLSIVAIYIVIRYLATMKESRKTFILIYLLFFIIYIYPSMSRNLHLDLQWGAAQSLIAEGISPNVIHGGLGFNNFYSLTYIDELYKDINAGRPINWHNLHPFAAFFVTSKSGLEKSQEGLLLYRSFSKESFFGFLKRKMYIYKRQEGYSKPIFI